MKIVIAIGTLVLVAVFSFFVTTWLAMVLGGMIGHFANNTWLMRLGFWQYAPVWVMVIILRAMFR
jgi:hypothetical protein